jgi:uncharacterized membrane protein
MDEITPDALEKKIRVGCGLIAGVVVGATTGLVWLGLRAGSLWAFVGIAAVVFAVLALRYGDRFWLELIEGFKGVQQWW